MAAEKRIKYLAGGEDRFSDLPHPIIHEILSQLSGKDVIRTCILSKSLLDALYCFPVLDLDSSWYSEQQNPNNNFIDSVDAHIRSRKITDTQFQKFKIRAHLTSLDHSSILCKSLKDNITNRLTELDIDFGPHRHSLPRKMTSASLLTTLNLAGLNIKCFNMMMNSWPVLENLSLTKCTGLNDFNFSSTKIKSITLCSCFGLNNIKIQSSSLQHLMFSAKPPKKFCEIDISQCQSINVLSLAHTRIADKWVENNIPRLLQIEELKLIQVENTSREMIVSSGSLKRLEWEGRSEIVEIKATNLEWLRYNQLGGYSIRVDPFINLKHMSMRSCPQIPHEFLKDHVYNFDGFESLELEYDKYCCLKRIEINDQKSLELLTVASGFVPIKVQIPCCLRGTSLLNPLQVTLNAKGPLDVTLTLTNRPVNKYCFIQLWNWIASFGHVRVFTIDLFMTEDLYCIKTLSGVVSIAPMSDLKHLTIRFSKWVYWFTGKSISLDFIDTCLRHSPNIETLCFTSVVIGAEPKKRSIQFHYGNRNGTKDDPPICCKLISMKCWRHSARKIELNNFDHAAAYKLEKFFLENAREVEIVKT